MTDESIPSLAEAMAEIRRLRERLQQSAEFAVVSRQLAIEVWQTEVKHLRARIAELESHAAMTFGTLAQPTEDAPAVITRGHAPSAPPHDE
jgi:hypothetical protein